MPQELAPGLDSATHPYLAAAGNKILAVFQAGAAAQSHGSHANGDHSQSSNTPHGVTGSRAYVAVFLPGLAQPQMFAIPAVAGSVSYPFAAVHANGQAAVAWTSTSGGKATAWLASGHFAR